jgi:hypothetical protein
MNYFYMIMNEFKLVMANEDLFGPEIEEEDSDGDLDRLFFYFWAYHDACLECIIY